MCLQSGRPREYIAKLPIKRRNKPARTNYLYTSYNLGYLELVYLFELPFFFFFEFDEPRSSLAAPTLWQRGGAKEKYANGKEKERERKREWKRFFSAPIAYRERTRPAHKPSRVPSHRETERRGAPLMQRPILRLEKREGCLGPDLSSPEERRKARTWACGPRAKDEDAAVIMIRFGRSVRQAAAQSSPPLLCFGPLAVCGKGVWALLLPTIESIVRH